MKIPQGNNILLYLQSQNQEIISPCNGKGNCGKCHIRIDGNPEPNKAEIEALSKEELKSRIRLACTRITEKDITIQKKNNMICHFLNEIHAMSCD